MLEVNNNEVDLTRGDTAKLKVNLRLKSTKQPYTMQEGETLTLTVKKSSTRRDYCFQKVIKKDEIFHIKPEDTENLDCGVYVYDVELRTTEGDKYTIFKKKPFRISEGVTEH